MSAKTTAVSRAKTKIVAINRRLKKAEAELAVAIKKEETKKKTVVKKKAPTKKATAKKTGSAKKVTAKKSGVAKKVTAKKGSSKRGRPAIAASSESQTGPAKGKGQARPKKMS